MSASPSSDAGKDDVDKQKKIAFRFCSECSNLLYPKEDKINSRLMFACRTCQYTAESISSRVTHNEISSSAGDTAGLTDDIGQDPTVSSDPPFDDESLVEDGGYILGLCTMCSNEIFCEICGQENVPGLTLEVNDYDIPVSHNASANQPNHFERELTPMSLSDRDASPVPQSPEDQDEDRSLNGST